MTSIKTSRGKMFAVRFIGIPMRSKNRIILEIEDHRMLSEISADFEALEYIEKTDDNRPGESVIYKGFSVLTGVNKNDDGTVRLTLEQEG